MIISQGKSDSFGDTQTYAQFAADYPTWFMTLTECSDDEQFNSNRDCPKQEIVNEFKLERHPTRNQIPYFFTLRVKCPIFFDILTFSYFMKIFKRTNFYLYPSNPTGTFELVKQIEETMSDIEGIAHCLILPSVLYK